MKNLFTILFLFAFSILGFAQDINNKPFIEISASADTLVVPDQIFLQITLKERESGRDEVELATLDKKLKEGIQKLGLSLEKLSLANANADYVQVKWNKKDVVSQTIYELELATATELAQVLEMLDELKIEDAFISRVKHSQEQQIKDAVERKAILLAKHKADLLLNAIGEETGKPLVIRHVNSGPMETMAIQVRGGRADVESVFIDGMKVKNDLSFKKLEYKAYLYVKFSIVQ